MDDKFSGPLGRASGSLRQLERSGVQLGRGLGQIGSGLDKLATRAAIGAVAGLTAVITTAASFEQAFTGVEKTVDGTDAQLGELEQTLRQMARTIPVSFEELSGIAAEGGALGIARDSLDEFTDVVARLSVSTNLTSEEAATALGQLGTVLHLSGKDFEDFADSLVGLGNAGASTEDQIIALAARFAAAGNSAGLSKEEILALSSATASMGIEVEAGGTALSQTFNGITKAIGTGSDEIKAYTKTLGISASEFKKRWTEDAIGTFRDFLGELSKLDKYQQADILEQAGITGIRQTNAIQLMTQNLGFFDDQLKVAKESQGALDKESQKFFDTSIGQWKLLVANVRDAAATIGAELLPVANSLIHDFIDKLQEPGTQQALKTFGTNLASGIKGLITELKGTDFSGIIGGMKIAAEVAKGAFNAFRSLPQPIQQLAIAALVANKVSGGAIGQIAKGLANVILGSGGILSGLLARGASPANPMWVQSVGGIGGSGGLPGGFNWKSLLPWLGGAAILGAVAAGAEFAVSEDRSPLINRPGGHLGPGDLPSNLKENTAALNENTDALVLGPTHAQLTGPLGVFLEKLPFGIGKELAKTVNKPLSDAELIRILAKTSEFGAKGVGTTIEHGSLAGTDPFGEQALELFRRAEFPKQGETLGEIQRHIIAAEEVQKAYLESGDINSAKRTQAVIDGMHALLGTVDETKPFTQRTAIETANIARMTKETLGTGRSTSEQTRQTALNTANAARLTGSLLEPVRNTAVQAANAARMTERTLNPLERIAARKTSFTANIYNSVQAYLSVTQAVYAQTLYKQIQYDDLGVGL